MAEFKDISQFTKVTPSGTEEIQISAAQKASLSDIAKLNKPDNVPTTEQMNSAISSALNTFKTDNVDPLNTKVTTLTGFMNSSKGSWQMYKDTPNVSIVDVTGGGQRHFVATGSAQTTLSVEVDIADDSFVLEADYAIVVLPKKCTPNFVYTQKDKQTLELKSEFPEPDTSDNNNYIVYVIQLLAEDDDQRVFAINAAEYTASVKS